MGNKKLQRQTKPIKGKENKASFPSSSSSIKVKMKAKEEGKGQCWACENPRVKVTHIIAKQDTAIRFLQSKGLMNFDRTLRSNAMGLCPSCRTEFDDMTNPGFAFWPEDLDFFIRFELRDRARRRLQSSGEQISRRVPTARQYRDHQRASHPDCAWGFYRRVHLADIHERRATELVPLKQWGGAPIAALRRAIGVIGCPRSARIPYLDISKLQILRDLYYGDWDKEEEVEKRLGLEPFAEPEDDIDRLDEFDQDDDDDDEIEEEEEEEDEEEEENDEEEHPPSKRRKIGPRRRAETPSKFNYENWCWDFGPQSSSEDKRREFIPQLMGPRSF